MIMTTTKAEEEYQIEKSRMLHEQRTTVGQVYEKKRAQNELSRKVSVLSTRPQRGSSLK